MRYKETCRNEQYKHHHSLLSKMFFCFCILLLSLGVILTSWHAVCLCMEVSEQKSLDWRKTAFHWRKKNSFLYTSVYDTGNTEALTMYSNPANVITNTSLCKAFHRAPRVCVTSFERAGTRVGIYVRGCAYECVWMHGKDVSLCVSTGQWVISDCGGVPWAWWCHRYQGDTEQRGEGLEQVTEY